MYIYYFDIYELVEFFSCDDYLCRKVNCYDGNDDKDDACRVTS